MRFFRGRFGQLEAILLPIRAADGTGPYEQGSSSHRLDRSVAAFYCILVIFVLPLFVVLQHGIQEAQEPSPWCSP